MTNKTITSLVIAISSLISVNNVFAAAPVKTPCISNAPRAVIFKADYSNKNMSGRTFNDIEFINSNFIKTDLTDTKFNNVTFVTTNLKGAKFPRANMDGVCFKQSNLTDTLFNRTSLKSVEVQKSILTRMIFGSSLVINSNLNNNSGKFNARLTTFVNTSFDTNKIATSNFNEGKMFNVIFKNNDIQNITVGGSEVDNLMLYSNYLGCTDFNTVRSGVNTIKLLNNKRTKICKK